MRYLKEYNLETDVQTALDNGELGKPYVAYIEGEDRIDWNSKEKTPDYSEQYLTFKITSAGTINVPRSTTYSINGGEWENTGTTLAVNGGESIRFKGTNGTGYMEESFCGSTAGFEVEGNIMSLIYGDNFVGKTSFPYDSQLLQYAFHTCTGLTSAENLILPATTLIAQFDYCYTNMFYNCTSLTTAPALPATTLGKFCYNYMFNGCTSLVNAPALPATNLADSCYSNMFNGCTSLVNAPELPSTSLKNSCYTNMFNGCTSLTTAPALPATTLANNCYKNMFQGCTSLTTAPELPATTLTINCYNNMFSGCTSLNYIKCLATNKSANGCTTDWLIGVGSKGTFVKKTGVSWYIGSSGYPAGWTVQEV